MCKEEVKYLFRCIGVITFVLIVAYGCLFNISLSLLPEGLALAYKVISIAIAVLSFIFSQIWAWS